MHPRHVPTTALAIEVASDESAREEAYRLRYNMYVEIMGRKQKYADHKRRIIKEPMDDDGVIYIARYGERAIGTIRRNVISDVSTKYYRSLYRADLFDDLAMGDVQLTTKLMVLPEFSGTAVPIKLIQKYADDAYDAGVRVDLIDCNSHLIRFFERLGYCSYLGWVEHEEYGQVRPMFFTLDTIEHMKRTQSALYSIAVKKLRDGAYGGYRRMRTLAERPMYEEGLRAWQALQEA